jgi:hypothetical protein
MWATESMTSFYFVGIRQTNAQNPYQLGVSLNKDIYSGVTSVGIKAIIEYTKTTD